MKITISSLLRLGVVLVVLLACSASTIFAALFPTTALGTYTGTIRVVDTKYGVNVTRRPAKEVTHCSSRVKARVLVEGTRPAPGTPIAR